MDALTDKQCNYLCAVADGAEQFTSMETLAKYNLDSTGNIRILKAALRKKDLIDIEGKRVFIQDPVFRLWLKTQFRRI